MQNSLKLVDFQTAKLAKACGFDWPSLNILSGLASTQHLIQTQHLLQKWLRDVKKVIVEVHPIDSWECWTYSILIEDCMTPFAEIPAPPEAEYPTFEDALEAGLFSALVDESYRQKR